MRNKVFFGLVLLSLCFIAGGIYIASSISNVIASLENVIALNQVEFIRNNLANQIKIVQADLLLKDSPHSRPIDVFVRHVEDMTGALSPCFGCHHKQSADLQLRDVENALLVYQKKLSRVYTLKANSGLLEREKQFSFALGESILDRVNSLAIPSGAKISHQIAAVRNDIANTRQLIIILVTLGPIVILLAASFFIHRFTGSVSTLIQATRQITDGGLSFRISKKLKDEFQELAVAFNEMAHSLQVQCERVESAQKWYRALFESAGDAIFILEAEEEEIGRIRSANKAAADLHGYPADELLQLTIRDLNTPESAGQMPHRLRRILSGEWISATFEHRKKDGVVFPVEVSAGLLEVDKKFYILAFARDISERVNTEKALQRSKQMAMVGQMAAGLAHEIKNPLAGIKVSMEVLATELNIPQEDREVFLRIVGEINRIEKLLKNLLDYARPPKPQFDAVDLNQIVDNALKNVQFTLKGQVSSSQQHKNIQIEKRLAEGLPSVLADSGQIQQVLLNLVLNGIESIAEDGEISVVTETDGQQVMIIISDSGKGIDEQVMEKIFTPFFTTKAKGTGLGLAVSRRLVEQHHGAIAVKNNAGGGATFTITLPAAPVN